VLLSTPAFEHFYSAPWSVILSPILGQALYLPARTVKLVSRQVRSSIVARRKTVAYFFADQAWFGVGTSAILYGWARNDVKRKSKRSFYRLFTEWMRVKLRKCALTHHTGRVQLHPRCLLQVPALSGIRDSAVHSMRVRTRRGWRWLGENAGWKCSPQCRSRLFCRWRLGMIVQCNSIC